MVNPWLTLITGHLPHGLLELDGEEIQLLLSSNAAECFAGEGQMVRFIGAAASQLPISASWACLALYCST